MKRALLAFFLIIALIGALSACKKGEEPSAEEELFEISFSTSALPYAANTPAKQIVKAGERVIEPHLEEEATAGYEVIWTRSEIEPVPYDFSAPVTESFTLRAVEILRTYSVIYLLNGGENVKKNPASYSKTSESILLYSLPEENCPDGYTFTKWSYDRDPDSIVTEIAAGSEGDIVLRAVYKANDYTIQYHNLQGAENTNVTRYVYGEEILLTGLVREGYLFKGWRYSSSGEIVPNGKLTTAFVHEYIYERSLSRTGCIDLYAVWEAIA